MSAALLPVEELLGLFELDDAGKVLYHRANSDSEPSVTSPGIEGCNFYEVVCFENMEELRRETLLSDLHPVWWIVNGWLAASYVVSMIVERDDRA